MLKLVYNNVKFYSFTFKEDSGCFERAFMLLCKMSICSENCEKEIPKNNYDNNWQLKKLVRGVSKEELALPHSLNILMVNPRYAAVSLLNWFYFLSKLIVLFFLEDSWVRYVLKK